MQAAGSVPLRHSAARAQIKKPRIAPGLLPLDLRSETVVQAGAHDIGLEVAARAGSTRDHVAAPKIDVEIFELGADRTPQCRFDAGAECPAGIGLRGTVDAGHGGAEIADRETAGDVGHELAGGVAES